jgi:hypothetical protein
VRVERVALEHHRDVAVLRLDVVDDALVDRDRAGVDLLEPGEHPQQRRLAAARRADQHHELAVRDVERNAVDDFRASKSLLDVAERDGRHGAVTP